MKNGEDEKIIDDLILEIEYIKEIEKEGESIFIFSLSLYFFIKVS